MCLTGLPSKVQQGEFRTEWSCLQKVCKCSCEAWLYHSSVGFSLAAPPGYWYCPHPRCVFMSFLLILSEITTIKICCLCKQESNLFWWKKKWYDDHGSRKSTICRRLWSISYQHKYPNMVRTENILMHLYGNIWWETASKYRNFILKSWMVIYQTRARL